MDNRVFRRNIPLLLLLLVTAAVYLQVCGHRFIACDDQPNIYENPFVLRGSAADFLHFWQEPYQKLYIPVTYNIWALLAKVAHYFPPDDSGLIDARIFHTANLLVHLLNTFLTYTILARLLKDDRAALAGALLFAIHPVQVEPVAWITAFRDVLSAFWGLMFFHQYLLYCENGVPGRRQYINYLQATVFFLLALLSKPTAMTMVGVAALAGHLLLRRSLFQLARELAPWCLMALAILMLTRFTQPLTPYAFQPLFWQRFLIVGDAIVFYLYKLLLPFNIGLDYGRSPQFVLAQGWLCWVTGVTPYLLAALLIWKGRRPWLFAAGIFLVGLLPTLGFISFDFQRISTVADRYLYLAMLGPAFATGLLFASCRQKSLGVLLISVLILLGLKSFAQTGYWKNGFILYEEALRVNPQSWLAFNNLGQKYYLKGQPEKASELFKKAIQVKPRHAKAYNNLANALSALGHQEEAIFHYNKALELAPDFHLAALNLGTTYRQINAYPEALNALQKAIAMKPDFAEAYNEIAILYSILNQPTEAIAAFEKAIEIKPRNASTYSNFGKLQADLGHTQKAIQLYQQALTLDSKLAEAAFNLGSAYELIGENESAALSFQKALQSRPNYVKPWIGLGGVYAKSNKLQQAIDAYNQAIAIDPGLIDEYFDLADIYLSTGQDQEAISVLLRLTGASPDFAPAYQRLGEINQSLGRTVEAEQYFKQAASLDFPRQLTP